MCIQGIRIRISGHKSTRVVWFWELSSGSTENLAGINTDACFQLVWSCSLALLLASDKQSSLVGVFLQHNSVWLRVTWSLYKKTKSTSYLLTGSLLVLGSNRMLAPSVHIWLWQNCSRWRPSTKERQTMRCHEGQQLPFLHERWKTKR